MFTRFELCKHAERDVTELSVFFEGKMATKCPYRQGYASCTVDERADGRQGR